jgi:hypothetical protein
MGRALRCVVALGWITALGAAPTLKVGSKLDALPAGKVTYRNVVVRSVSASNVMISHDGGMASVPLRSLSPDLQTAFGYSPEAEAAAAAAAQTAQLERQLATGAEPKTTLPKPRPAGAHSNFDRLLQKFGQAPEIRSSVDLRPQFVELALGVKNQGPRPSCAVFAIVSALEFQNAQINGKSEQFSEEYLIWATSKLLNRPTVARDTTQTEATESLDSLDIGFTLTDVVSALRSYGIPAQTELPYNYAHDASVAEPPAAVVAGAQAHNRVSIFPLPGHDASARVANLIQALNHGVPVPIGLAWPSWRALRTGFINTQIPSGGGHAVTLVGYDNKTGDIKDTVFIFKNSWGVRWGTGGYGFVTYSYVSKNLVEAVLLDVAAVPRR